MEAMRKSMDALALANQGTAKGKALQTPPPTHSAPSPASSIRTNPKAKSAPKSHPASNSRKVPASSKEPQEDSGDEAGMGHDDETENDASEEEEVSEAAKRQRLRRLCERKGRGNLKVPEQIHKMWLEGGHSRDQLLEIFEDSGFDKDRMVSTLHNYRCCCSQCSSDLLFKSCTKNVAGCLRFKGHAQQGKGH